MVATRGDPARRQAAGCTSDHPPEKASQSARYLLFRVGSASARQKPRQRGQGSPRNSLPINFLTSDWLARHAGPAPTQKTVRNPVRNRTLQLQSGQPADLRADVAILREVPARLT